MLGKIMYTAWLKRLWITLYDSSLGGVCMYGVIRIRYSLEEKFVPDNLDIKAAIVFGLTCFGVWIMSHISRAVWRFTSPKDVRALLQGVCMVSLITPIVLFLFFNRAEYFPRSAPIINGLLFFSLLMLSRGIHLFFSNGDIRAFLRSTRRDFPPAVGIGESRALHNYIRNEMQKKSKPAYNIVGLIETAGNYKGRCISSIPVFGNLDDIYNIISGAEATYGKKPTLICMDHKIGHEKINKIAKLAAQTGTRLLRVQPGHNGKLTQFEATDLIGRQAKELNMSPVYRMIKDKRVLITGAGGTIGSELTHQIALFEPAHLSLIDISEMNLYLIDLDMADIEGLSYSTFLGNVCDKTHMEEIVTSEKPEIILHAAALKHVPLMETNPIEAIKTNIGGTKVMVDLAIKHKVDSFTLISTDKAVSPNNIMGASKRVAEILILSIAKNRANISASAVRFGNVLASNGSVVPLFEKQIEAGGPVTVTDKNATRFFMTTTEAASLVLQATVLNMTKSQPGVAIYVLDMGDPVNITHLAKQLIQLRGCVPGQDIKIKYTGLRPGEKLTEKLKSSKENLQSTHVKGIMRFTGHVFDPKSVNSRIDKLLTAAQKRDLKGVKNSLTWLVPEFESKMGLPKGKDSCSRAQK